MDDLGERLRSAAVGSPAKIAWPHRLLHEADAELARLRAEVEDLQLRIKGLHIQYRAEVENLKGLLKRHDTCWRALHGLHGREYVGQLRDDTRAALAPDGKGKE